MVPIRYTLTVKSIITHLEIESKSYEVVNPLNGVVEGLKQAS